MGNKCTETIENIVIIPSYIGSTNSVYTPQQRYEQTKKTIQSVQDKIPNCYIVFIDITKLNQEQNEYFKQNTDLFLNETENEELKSKVLHNKSYGEISYLIYSIDVCNDFELDYTFKRFPKLKAFYKITGRYYLNEYFDYNKFNVYKDVCKIGSRYFVKENFDIDMNLQTEIDPKNWVNSCIYKILYININKFINIIKSNSFFLYKNNGSIEQVIAFYFYNCKLYKDFIILNILGLTTLFTSSNELNNI